jgi:hypothetical protein
MFLMSHKSSASYLPYQSKISTIDFVAMFRHIDLRSVEALVGISLNRSSAAPVQVSKAGQQAICEDDAVVSASREMDTLRNTVLERHKSLTAAARSSDPLWEDFKQISTVYRSAVLSVTRRVLKYEYKQHFEQLAHTVPAAESQAPCLSQDSPLDNVQSSLCDESSLFVPENGDATTATFVTPEDAIELALDMIDPRLRGGDLSSEGEEEEEEQEESMDDMVGAEDSYGGVLIHEDQINSTPSTSTALHGMPNDVRGSLKNRFLTKRGCSAYNDFLAELENAWQGTEADTSACLIRWYSVCHSIDQFPPGEEPIPGTFSCRFCGKDMSDIHHPYEHTRACAKKDAAVRAQALLDSASPLDQPCQYQICGNKETFGEFVTCDQTFGTIAKRGEHMRSHVRTMTKKGNDGTKVPTCFFGACASNPKGGRLNRGGPDFADEDEQLAHVWSQHHVTTLKTPGVVYCEYCDIWLLEPHEWITHATTHLDDAQSIVAEFGYCGVRVGRTVVPRLCPFCFHDETLPIHERISTYSREGHLAHVAVHVKAVEGTRQLCPCYPTMCTKSDHMDADQQKDHLNLNHGLSLPTRHSKGLGRALSDVTNAHGPTKKAKKGKHT